MGVIVVSNELYLTYLRKLVAVGVNINLELIVDLRKIDEKNGNTFLTFCNRRLIK